MVVPLVAGLILVSLRANQVSQVDAGGIEHQLVV
jgi:hypothetical protein